MTRSEIVNNLIKENKISELKEYDIVSLVFGEGNLESFEIEEAKNLVKLTKAILMEKICKWLECYAETYTYTVAEMPYIDEERLIEDLRKIMNE